MLKITFLIFTVIASCTKGPEIPSPQTKTPEAAVVPETDTSGIKTFYKGKLQKDSPIEALLQIPSNWNDPGVFTKLTFTKDNKTVLEISDLQAEKFSSLGTPLEAEKIEGTLAVFPHGPNLKNYFVAFQNFTGGDTESGSELFIINLDSEKPTVVFKNGVTFRDIDDYDKDGLYDLKKEGGPYISLDKEYNPYLIYRQTKSDGKISFKLDIPLSKKYTEENKYPWKGVKAYYK